MKKIFALLLASPLVLSAQKDYTKLVNPFIGTGGHGHTYPGATYPFGMMQLSPDTRMADWDGSSGYHYSDSVIYGFSHTHLSGTGIPDYCDVLLMPFTGAVSWEPAQYRSSFTHQKEKASPGYYEVMLDKHAIKAQLTTSVRSGMHQYTFPSGTKEGKVLIDLKHRDIVLGAHLEKVDDYTLRGYRFSQSWATNQKLYFYIRFQRPIREWKVREEAKDPAASKGLQAYATFDLKGGEPLLCKVGISGVSMEGAQKNLEAEISGWSFESVRLKARQAWNSELSKIDVSGGSMDQQTVFYTALYHASVVPNIYQDVDGRYRGTDDRIHQARGFTNYSVFSLWDTYRAYHPMMSILNRKRTQDWIQTFLAQYKQGGMLPVWELSANETFCMIGYHAVPVIVDAYKKGIRGFDEKLALQAMRSYAESNRFGLDQYKRLGYISNDHEHESVSKTLEYAYDDWGIAQFARMLGNDSVYQYYTRRAQNYKNVFDPQTGHMRGKLGALWHSPFDAREINNYYTEGNSWHYTFAVPQDIEGLINLHGGKEGFTRKLNELFTTTSQTTGRDQADVTGLIGQYAQGNEPSHHMAYLFNYLGQPWRTQELVDTICRVFYTNAPDGLIGNEDCGQMSAWYIMSALGFYPVTPGSTEYVMGKPLFDKAVIRLENGKTFTVVADRSAAGAKYVSGVQMNGREHKATYLEHKDIEKGGLMKVTLATSPNTKRGTTAPDMPHSSIRDYLLLPTPYVAVPTHKFRDSLVVQLGHPFPGVTYTVKGRTVSTRGSSFVVRQTDTVSITAEKMGVKSETVQQLFYKLPSDKTIKVSSKVHPLYTAGGDETLIDGILGNTNWKSGEWQSYFDQDFEATIDLKQVKPIRYLGVHVLQDVSPWILYPSEVIFYTSTDGQQFTEAGRVQNKIGKEEKGAMVQDLGIAIEGNARYVRVKASSGGKLPAWHESAGNPSHLFIDEVIVR